MISSTTAGTGAKAATSKEVHELKRKVLENNLNGPTMNATNKLTTSSAHGSLLKAKLKRILEPEYFQAKAPQQVHDGATSRNVGGRKIKGVLDEVEDDCPATKAKMFRGAHAFAASKKAGSTPKREKRDPKPGYCENCRDKFNDFEEHITSRKHRKFAMTASNWVELDHILDYIHSPGYQNMAQRSVTSWDPSDDEEKF
ncbi:hypothetical protein KEM54_003264 [Ascosphaera aggregata]|nr:hypothetical protein KEM54_003264 [Ascosphaera aggregata]